MAYREIGISIRSAYSQGWPDDAARLAFRAETRKLFRNAGWQVEEMPLDSGHCDTVRNGKDALYLHPTVFSGVIHAWASVVIEYGEEVRKLEQRMAELAAADEAADQNAGGQYSIADEH